MVTSQNLQTDPSLISAASEQVTVLWTGNIIDLCATSVASALCAGFTSVGTGDTHPLCSSLGQPGGSSVPGAF